MTRDELVQTIKKVIQDSCAITGYGVARPEEMIADAILAKCFCASGTHEDHYRLDIVKPCYYGNEAKYQKWADCLHQIAVSMCASGDERATRLEEIARGMREDGQDSKQGHP